MEPPLQIFAERSIVYNFDTGYDSVQKMKEFEMQSEKSRIVERPINMPETMPPAIDVPSLSPNPLMSSAPSSSTSSTLQSSDEPNARMDALEAKVAQLLQKDVQPVSTPPEIVEGVPKNFDLGIQAFSEAAESLLKPSNSDASEDASLQYSAALTSNDHYDILLAMNTVRQKHDTSNTSVQCSNQFLLTSKLMERAKAFKALPFGRKRDVFELFQPREQGHLLIHGLVPLERATLFRDLSTVQRKAVLAAMSQSDRSALLLETGESSTFWNFFTLSGEETVNVFPATSKVCAPTQM